MAKSLRAKILSKLPRRREFLNECDTSESANVKVGPNIPSNVKEPDKLLASDDPLDSDGSSSIGDHLVNLDEIDLDSDFFSQEFPTADTTNDVKQPGWNSTSELTAEDSSETKIDTDENEQINQLLSQLIDYEQSRQEAIKHIENHRLQTVNIKCEKEDIVNVINGVENLTDEFAVVTEDNSDEEWQHVKNYSNNERINTEVIINQQTNKDGKFVDIGAQFKRLLQNEKRDKQLQLHKVHLLCMLGYGFHLNKLVRNIVINNCHNIFEILEHFDIGSTQETEVKYISKICNTFSRIDGVVELSRNMFRGSDASVVLLLLAVLRFLAIEARLAFHLNVISKNPGQTNKKPCAKTRQPLRRRKVNEIYSIPTERYLDVPLTTSEILKQKPEFANFYHISQVDGADDGIGEKRLRLDCSSTSKPSLWKLKHQAPCNLKSDQKLLNNRDSSILSEKTSRFFKHPADNKSFETRSSHSKLSRQKKKLPLTEKTSRFFKQLTNMDNHKDIIVQSAILEKRNFRNSQFYWIEVYLPAEKRWITVDIVSGQIDCLDYIVHQLLPQPVMYVFGWSNDGSFQDISGRYWWQNEAASKRLRVADKWLKIIAQTYGKHRKEIQDLLDERDFRRLRFRAPIPQKITDFKNHPSYCLKRDLLKFQAIYPPDAPPLGFFRDEAIYARECVHTLHSREVWLRHAKVIRLNELPYKVVMSKLKREKTELELFGHWQTDDYVPPKAIGGRVPRNAFGNIELFKDCMLPEGTVHLKQTNISKICRRLNVDYAIAVVGFGIHAGGNHPIFEGIVICKEFEQLVLEEYERDLLEQEIRMHEKRKNRIYGNWRKLCRGLQIRNKLKNKYNFIDM